MKMSRVLTLGLVAGTLMLLGASSARATTVYSAGRCQPLTNATTLPIPVSVWMYNWAYQLYNPTNHIVVYRCPVDDNSAAPVSQVTVTGWSAGCINSGNAGYNPQLTGQACVIPKAGAAPLCQGGEPLVGGGPTVDCTAGVKSFTMQFKPHSFGDALEVQVAMDVSLENSNGTFWVYSAN